jgi:hypothetical protein
MIVISNDTLNYGGENQKEIIIILLKYGERSI